jgi:uncharacterized membrane protein YoaK (UPF0700 family)
VRDGLLMALTFSSGAVDAICYLALGKVFTAFMTGNIVFLGLRAAGASGPNIASVAVALAVFSGGAFLATRIVEPSRGSDVWPRRVTAALGVAAIVHACFVALWLAVGDSPSQGAVDVLLGVSALAMGTQTGAVFALGVPGVFTTAATATTTALMGDTAHWAQTAPDRRRLAGVLAALLAGAIAGGLLVVHARSLAPVLPLLTTTLVLATATFAARAGDAAHERERGHHKAPPAHGGAH